MHRASKLLSVIFYIAISSFFTVYSQDKDGPKEWFVEAESYFLFEEYKDALPLYQKILRVDPENYNVIYKIGMCYLNDKFQKEKAISYLEKAAANVNYDFKLNNYKERLAPPEAIYYLGKAYLVNNRFNEAIENYNRFLNTANPKEFDFDLVNEDIRACQLAKKVYAKPIYFSPKNLGNAINSRFDDINPVLSGDGKILAFTRRLQFYDGVFVSVKNDDGSWSEPVNLTEDFGLDGNSYTTGISYFGDEIFVYRSDDYDGNIYSSKRINNKWSRLGKLNDHINTKFWESHASPSPDGQYLIFTSNRDGGYGGLDIYKSKRNTVGDWGPAINLGPVINSPSNEETPFLSNDGYTIFFSSQGHNTIGGYDVFMSNVQSDGVWTKPYNMGYPLNTSDDDLFYYPVGVNNFGLYSFYSDKSSLGLSDIYEVEVYNNEIPRKFSLSGKVNIADADANSFKKISVKLINPKTNQVLSKPEVDDKGNFSIQASQGDYLLVIEGSEIETLRKNVNLEVSQQKSDIALPDILLTRTSIPAKPVEEVALKVAEPIIAKKTYYTVTDSLRVPIELILPKGADLEVLIKVDNNTVKTQHIPDVKRRFTYFYQPLPGENVITFTATDPEGLVSTTEVTVTYYPPGPVAESKPEKAITKEGPVDSETLNSIAEGKLREYLSSIDLNEYENYYELYSHLNEVATEEGFTQHEINRLFSIFFTQRDGERFNTEFENIVPGDDPRRAQLADSIKMPLTFLKTLISLHILSQDQIQNTLLQMQDDNHVTADKFYRRMVSFSDIANASELHNDRFRNLGGAYSDIATKTDNHSALNALMLLSTTDDLQFFYQNLLLNSDSGLHDYLVELKFEESGINNSIELAENLFENAAAETYTSAQLIRTFELARSNRQYYLDRFIEILTQHGEGNLKSELVLLNKDKGQIRKFEDLFGYLLNQSKYKNYSPESIYNLFLELIGIDNVEEFADKLESYGYTAINLAIGDTSIGNFSNPFELIQYLLTATHTYDFSESDINNLLIRMILEKGFDIQSIRSIDEMEGKLWKSRKFVTTIILVNIVLLILILFFVLRKRR